MTFQPTLSVIDPEDQSLVAEVMRSTDDDIEQALVRGNAASTKQAPSLKDRASVLYAVANIVRDQAQTFAATIAREGIKTIREAEAETLRCVQTLMLAAEHVAIGVRGESYSSTQGNGQDRLGWTYNRSIGLAVAITPFNDPLNLVAHKFAPAYAAGTPIILKPHPQTPLSALGLHRAFMDAGADPDMVQIIIGDAKAGMALVSDNRPRIISFTGGRKAGRSIAEIAGLKKLLMELGGPCSVAVFADADLEKAAAAIHSGAFWAAGQNCLHAQRIIAERSIVGDLRSLLVDHASRMNLTSKRDPACDMGPMVNEDAAKRIESSIDNATCDGGRIILGGKRVGTRITPTWIEGLPDNHPMLRTEIFGPVSTLEAADGRDMIIERLASAEHSIHAGIFTSSIDTSIKVFDVARSGAVLVNDSTDFRTDDMPFGGPGNAGLGREGISNSIAAFTEPRMLLLRRAA